MLLHGLALTLGSLATGSLALGCGGVLPTEDAGGDVGDAPVPENGELVLGTGELDFTPITEGQTLLLARGCQGSQHVWISLRASSDFNPRGMNVQLELRRTSDGLRRSLEFLVRLSFETTAAGHTLPGLTLQVPESELTIGESLALVATITDASGRASRASRQVQVAWGTETCTAG